MIAQYDWDKALAYRIMMCESGASTTVINNNPSTGDYSVGLFQINIKDDLANHRPSEEELQATSTNIAFAYQLYQNGGWRHWTNCFNKEVGKTS